MNQSGTQDAINEYKNEIGMIWVSRIYIYSRYNLTFQMKPYSLLKEVCACVFLGYSEHIYDNTIA